MRRAARIPGARKQRKVRTLRRIYGDGCWLCGEAMDFDAPREADRAATLDHVVPASLGGSNRNENLRLAHRVCNGARGAQAA